MYGRIGSIPHDTYIENINPDDADAVTVEERWYTTYDAKTNEAIKRAREYVEHTEFIKTDVEKTKHVKLKKLEIPKFGGDPKEYYKWKSVYERYTKEYDDETKYDYLLNSTSGEARRYVENKTTYNEAITRLDEKYGNIHIIMGILINEVKSLQIVRRGDFRAFEQLSLKVDEFHDRLKLMGKENDVENGYVLKEIESKLNYEDAQKWLESSGDQVDVRTVKDLMKWLEHQTHLRRITFNSYGTSTSRNLPPVIKRTSGSTLVGVCPNCPSSSHYLSECLEFLKLSYDDRWERVKFLRCCFVCLKLGHRRPECTGPLCNLCSRPNHPTIHRTIPPISSAPVSRDVTCAPIISRSFLPILRVPLQSWKRGKECTAVLDSVSEISIISSRCSQQLGLIGEPFNLQIVGAGGVAKSMKTKKVKLHAVDRMGKSHGIECVVLTKACGRALELEKAIINDIGATRIKEKEIYTHGGEVDILIGMSNPELHKQFKMETLKNGLIIMETCFGHCLVGPKPTKHIAYEGGVYNTNWISVLHDDPDEMLWRNHLQAELAGVSIVEEEIKSEDEKNFDQRMKINRIEEEENRLEISLAWKYNPETFENNRQEVVECDKKLMKQLEKNPTVYELFEKQVKEMIELRVLKKVEKYLPKRYLPLLVVSDLERESTKVRICLDAKRKFNGVSFNDFLLKGKLEMSDLFGVLTGFRSGDTAIQGDVKKDVLANFTQ